MFQEMFQEIRMKEAYEHYQEALAAKEAEFAAKVDESPIRPKLMSEDADELAFYWEALRWRSFDEVPECGGEINVQIKVADGVGWSSCFVDENSVWKRTPDSMFSYNAAELKELGFSGWRRTPGDVIGEWNEIKGVKNG